MRGARLCVMQPLEKIGVRLADGRKLLVRYRPSHADREVIQQIFRDREYDLRRLTRYGEIEGFLARQREKGLTPLIVDAGANIGASSVAFAVFVPGSTVVAIEPEESNFQVLLNNCE